MKVPSKRQFEKILESHTKLKNVKVKQDAASLMYLRYLLFMKNLAKEADNMAYRQRRITLKPADVIEAEKIIGNVSETAKIVARKRPRNSSSLRSRVSDTSSIPEKENENPDSPDSEESE